MTGARIERLVTSGTFTLDDGTWDVDNNAWIVGDDHEAVVIDAAQDADAITRALGGRTLRAIVCTHAHNDHTDAAPGLAARTGSSILLHADDLPLWKQTHPQHPACADQIPRLSGRARAGRATAAPCDGRAVRSAPTSRRDGSAWAPCSLLLPSSLPLATGSPDPVSACSRGWLGTFGMRRGQSPEPVRPGYWTP